MKCPGCGGDMIWDAEFEDGYVRQWYECVCGVEKHNTKREGWATFMGEGEAHLIPIEDIDEHYLEYECKCSPEIVICDGGVVISHRAWDHRQVIEEAYDAMESG